MFRTARPGALVALVVAGALALACGRPARPPGDVLLILIDTLRPDHLGFYGHHRETAPFLAEWAQDAAVFERAYSTSSWTAPSTASVFTGLYPTRHGVIEGFFAHRGRMRAVAEEGDTTVPLNRLPSDVATLAERFRDGGYRTFGAASNVNIGPALGFDRGFDRFLYAHKRSARKLFRAIDDWADEIRTSPAPVFVYLHLNDVHSPYEKRPDWYRPEPDPRADLEAAYDGQISYLDAQIARFVERVGWGPETFVAVASDHGEGFGEHRFLRHDGGLHQELTRVLLMLRGPGIEPRRIHENVSLIDVMPTLLDLAGLPLPEDADGLSLAGLVRGADGDDAAETLRARTLFAHRAMKGEDFGDHWWAAVRGSWKLIEEPTGSMLFDLDDDFTEQRDLSADEPERVSALSQSLDEFRRGGFRDSASDRIEVELDAETLEHLRELGYVEPAQP